jgi:hypothetical protein
MGGREGGRGPAFQLTYPGLQLGAYAPSVGRHTPSPHEIRKKWEKEEG